MLTPGAKRKAVAHAREVFEVSERPLPGSGLHANRERGRAKSWERIGRRFAIERGGQMKRNCVKRSAPWLSNVAASATGGST